MRTREFFTILVHLFGIPETKLPQAEERIVSRVIELVKQRGRPMAGVSYIFDFFKEWNFNIGLATSSGQALIEVVTDMLDIKKDLGAFSSQ